MAFTTWLRIWKTHFEGRQTRRTRRQSASPKRATGKLSMEQLEDRLTPSGFGPEDGAYIVESWSGSYSDVQVQPGDQKIVAAGQVNPNNDGTDQRMAIARYDPLGNLDTSYGTGGPSIPPLSGVAAPTLGPSNEYGNDLVLQPDGKAVVSGSALYGTLDSGFAVARFNTNGTLDSGFGSGGWNSLDARASDYNPAFAVGLQSTGKVVVAGVSAASNYPNGTLVSAEVARFTASGAIDSGKGGFGQIVQGKATGYTFSYFGMTYSRFHDVAVQPDDRLVAVGYAYTVGTQGRLVVARYTTSGTLDTTFNGSGFSLFLPAGITDAYGSAVALQSNGKIVVTGFCTGTDGANDMLVARYNTNGTLDISFGGGKGYVRLDDSAATQSQERGNDVAIQPNGKIVVGGSTSSVTGLWNVLVARFNVDGTPDETFAAGGYKIGAPLPNTGYHSFEGEGVALQADGSIIVAGSDDWDSTDTFAPHPFLMRFLGSPPSPLQAAGGAALAHSVTQPLTRAHVQPLLTEAIARWQTAGMDVSALSGIDIRIANLGGSTLGLASGNTIWLDDNAAGWGWFVDATPWDDSEFTTPGDQGEQNRMDLLTVLAHELGHLLGHDHEEDGVMADTLDTGTRRSLEGGEVIEWSAVFDLVSSESVLMKRRR